MYINVRANQWCVVTRRRRLSGPSRGLCSSWNQASEIACGRVSRLLFPCCATLYPALPMCNIAWRDTNVSSFISLTLGEFRSFGRETETSSSPLQLPTLTPPCFGGTLMLNNDSTTSVWHNIPQCIIQYAVTGPNVQSPWQLVSHPWRILANMYSRYVRT